MDKQSPIKIWFSFVFRMIFFAIALMWPAGSWYWWEAWVVVVLWSVYGLVMVVYLLRYDIELLAERMKFVPIDKEQKIWD